jgi:hypothetical protein
MEQPMGDIKTKISNHNTHQKPEEIRNQTIASLNLWSQMEDGASENKSFAFTQSDPLEGEGGKDLFFHLNYPRHKLAFERIISFNHSFNSQAHPIKGEGASQPEQDDLMKEGQGFISQDPEKELLDQGARHGNFEKKLNLGQRGKKPPPDGAEPQVNLFF